MKRTQNFLPAAVMNLNAPGEALPPMASYVFNEGQLNLRVLQERSLHMLTLAQDDGVPLTLSLSRGVKDASTLLPDCLQQQLDAVAQDARQFVQQPLQEFKLARSPASTSGYPKCLVTEVTYHLAELSVHQTVGVIQLNEQYLLFVTLTRPQGFTDATRMEWRRILSSFLSRETVLPEPGDGLFGLDEDEEDNVG